MKYIKLLFFYFMFFLIFIFTVCNLIRIPDKNLIKNHHDNLNSKSADYYDRYKRKVPNFDFDVKEDELQIPEDIEWLERIENITSFTLNDVNCTSVRITPEKNIPGKDKHKICNILEDRLFDDKNYGSLAQCKYEHNALELDTINQIYKASTDILNECDFESNESNACEEVLKNVNTKSARCICDKTSNLRNKGSNDVINDCCVKESLEQFKFDKKYALFYDEKDKNYYEYCKEYDYKNIVKEKKDSIFESQEDNDWYEEDSEYDEEEQTTKDNDGKGVVKNTEKTTTSEIVGDLLTDSEDGPELSISINKETNVCNSQAHINSELALPLIALSYGFNRLVN